MSIAIKKMYNILYYYKGRIAVPNNITFLNILQIISYENAIYLT